MARTSRREFIKFSYKAMGAASLLATFPYFSEVASAQQQDYKALVCIFLEGGNDGINTIVPLDANEYRYYQSIRSAFAIPQQQLLRVTPASEGKPYGFHPALTGLHGIWNSGKLAVVPNVGPLVAPIATKDEFHNNRLLRPEGLYDHYTQSLTWQFCDFRRGRGWGHEISQYVKSLNTAPKIPMLLSMSDEHDFLKGLDPAMSLRPGVNLKLEGSNPDDTRYQALRELLKAEDTTSTQVKALAEKVSNAIDDGALITEILENSEAVKTQFPDTGLGQRMQQIARVIAARSVLGLDRRQIFAVRHGGFDTHENQLKGHNNRLKELSDAMAAFYNATVELNLANQVTTFTVSDFGRNIRANENEGTDHGWGGHSFVMGGAVKGGNFYGKYPSIEVGGPDDIDRNSKDRGTLLPRISVDQYGSTIAAWYGLDDNARRAIFPHLGRFDDHDLGFMT